MFREVTKTIHCFCSSKGIFQSIDISFIFIVFFINLILFYVNDSVVLTKKNLFLHDFCCFWFCFFFFCTSKPIGHFRITFSLFRKVSLGAQPFIWKWDLIHMQIKLIFMWMVVPQALLWERGFR